MKTSNHPRRHWIPAFEHDSSRLALFHPKPIKIRTRLEAVQKTLRASMSSEDFFIDRVFSRYTFSAPPEDLCR